ncbi:MAG: NUMOD3 domain-containing DNA-binding protein [Candidatus Wildermuthbacteria bacterium]|nr:NUMOD3 domain-containing DNA-binding protein [Candidatus Wildermuthbacteria bacterium]
MVLLKCKICNKSFKVKPYKKESAKYCSYKCRDIDFKDRFRGENNHFYGKKHSSETKTKLSKSHKGLLTGRKHPFWGKHHSEKTKKKISESVKMNPVKYWLGKKRSVSFRKKLSEIKKKNPSKYWMGKKRPTFSKEWLKKIAEAIKIRHGQKTFGFLGGEKNISWNGGLSYKTHNYGSGWTGYLKTRIKERDGDTCQLCGDYKNLAVHHIDYNKQNCNKNNLITLCRSCNVKVNFDRKKWEKLLKQKIVDAYLSIH